MNFVNVFDELIRQILVIKNCTVDELTQQDIDFANETAQKMCGERRPE